MNKKPQTAGRFQSASQKLRLGFVPLTDCAPLVMARELGLFQKYGLRVELSRELGWATIRDKIIHGELDAAHALAAMPIAAALGLGSIPCDCLTALVLNLNGNAITLSEDLWKRGVRDGKTLRAEILRSRREKMLTFGVVFRFSSHRHLLRRWLTTHGIDADRDVRIVVVPPPQMAANLQAGHLDGFCAGEPWNSAAVQSRAGWIAATSAELDPAHPEKVLMVRGDFAAKRSEEHVALVAALLEACEFCDQPENHGPIIKLLARPEYVGVAESALRHGITGRMDFGHGTEREVRDFCTFYRDGANAPSGDKVAWLLNLVWTSGLNGSHPLPLHPPSPASRSWVRGEGREGGEGQTTMPVPSAINFAFGRKIFRADIFEKSVQLRDSTPNPNEYETELEPVPV